MITPLFLFANDASVRSVFSLLHVEYPNLGPALLKV